MGNEILNAALEYAAAGLKVLPLMPHGKAPCVKNWTNCATTNAEQIKEWWDKYPEANVGICCGNTENGRFLTVIDLDNHNGKDGFAALYEWQKMNNSPLPETLIARSGGGGLHYFFFTDKPYKSRADILGEGSGVDVRSKGGQIVAAPSIHTCGKRYEWESGFNISKIADGGAVLDKLLTERETKESTPAQTTQAARPLKITGDITDTIAAKLHLDFGEEYVMRRFGSQ